MIILKTALLIQLPFKKLHICLWAQWVLCPPYHLSMKRLSKKLLEHKYFHGQLETKHPWVIQHEINSNTGHCRVGYQQLLGSWHSSIHLALLSLLWRDNPYSCLFPSLKTFQALKQTDAVSRIAVY